VAASLVFYARSLPAKSSGTGYTLPGLVNDLLDHARSQMSSNTTVIPVLQTFNVLLEGDVLGRLSEDAEGIAWYVQLYTTLNLGVHRAHRATSLRSLFWISTQQVPRLKNVQRIHESMKMWV
jgi:tubulin-specific chaperone D